MQVVGWPLARPGESAHSSAAVMKFVSDINTTTKVWFAAVAQRWTTLVVRAPCTARVLLRCIRR